MEFGLKVARTHVLDCSDEQAVWVGLRQRRTTGPLEWTNENTVPYNMHYYGTLCDVVLERFVKPNTHRRFPTRLNCQVASRRRYVLNSQLAHDDYR